MKTSGVLENARFTVSYNSFLKRWVFHAEKSKLSLSAFPRNVGPKASVAVDAGTICFYPEMSKKGKEGHPDGEIRQRINLIQLKSADLNLD